MNQPKQMIIKIKLLKPDYPFNIDWDEEEN